MGINIRARILEKIRRIAILEDGLNRLDKKNNYVHETKY